MRGNETGSANFFDHLPQVRFVIPTRDDSVHGEHFVRMEWSPFL